MPKIRFTVAIIAALLCSPVAFADQLMIKTHCGKCHGGRKPKADFDIKLLGDAVDAENVDFWVNSLDYVKAGDMPPAKQNHLTKTDRRRLIRYLKERINQYNQEPRELAPLAPRRLNNRELLNSISDVLMIEDVGTHQPTASLLADTLHDGFDTNGEALGISEFHLEQYIAAFRKIVDATILSGQRPKTRFYDVSSQHLRLTDQSNRKRAERANRTANSIEILDIRKRVYFANFETVPTTGRYRIKIRATGVDRNVYDSEETGHYKDDPIRLRVHLGDRTRDFVLPDEDVMEIELDEWLAAGSSIELSYPTDALRLKGNGNFKFQYRIAHDYLKENDPELYNKVVAEIVPKSEYRSKAPSHWSHWTDYWQGPRPRLFGAEVEGPIYDSWPPRRQQALIGSDPKVEDAAKILRPIASRAWRRNVAEQELDPIVGLVQSRAADIGDVEALKEGIVAILVSPSFLMINPEQGEPADRFATKLSLFINSTIPDQATRAAVRDGKLASFAAVRQELQRQIEQGQADEFLREFPHAWLQLDRINFMAPDPDRYALYDRKRISDDMINETLHFFRHAVEQNLPVTELLSADYSFLNADLAKVYGVDGVARDSQFRQYTFTDGRRGGLLGMGAFLTLTADSLGTSPIHRAVYVMENFLGIHPSPPPADVKIEEPDVRSAKTIKEVLEAHRNDKTCAACHQAIDPFGYAFENFDPMGAWRDMYTEQIAPTPSRQELAEIKQEDARRAAEGLPAVPKPWENQPVTIDASASFMSGAEYSDIRGFRQLMQTKANRERFVRCFITKLLVYANGEEPDDYSEVEKIVARSAENDYRIVDTIAAVIDSPLFRRR